MARGWESKAVEAQQQDRDRGPYYVKGPTPQERERQARQDSLQLALLRLRGDLASSSVAAHQVMLKRAIEDVERELRQIREPGSAA